MNPPGVQSGMVRLSPAHIALALLTVMLPACTLGTCANSQNEYPPGPTPSTLPVLTLTPDSAAAVVAFPPVDAVGETMVTVLRRTVVGLDVAMLDGVLAALEEELHSADGRRAVSEALASVGFDTAAPAGLFLRGSNAGESGYGVAFMFSASDPEKIRNWLETIGLLFYDVRGNELSIDEIEPAERYATIGNVTIANPLAYTIHDNRVIVGIDRRFIAEIDRRAANPYPVDYGTAVCPSFTPDAFTALVRMNRTGDALRPLLNAWLETNGLSELLAGQLPGTESSFSDNPLLLTFDWGPDKIEMAARADLIEHEGLRNNLGRPSRVRLAQAVPASTLGLVSFRFNENNKALLLDLFGRMFVQGGFGEGASELTDAFPAEGIDLADFPVADTLGQWMQFVDDEVTLALTTVDAQQPEGVAMLAVRNRNMLSNLLLTLPVPGEPVETYRRIEIRIMPGSTMHYATARNTVVIGNNLDEVRETLGHLIDKEISPAYDAFKPAIELDRPRYVALHARSTAIAEVIATFLNVPEWGLTLIDGAEAAMQDIRVTGGVTGEWLDTRMTVHFAPESTPEPAP